MTVTTGYVEATAAWADTVNEYLEKGEADQALADQMVYTGTDLTKIIKAVSELALRWMQHRPSDGFTRVEASRDLFKAMGGAL